MFRTLLLLVGLLLIGGARVVQAQTGSPLIIDWKKEVETAKVRGVVKAHILVFADGTLRQAVAKQAGLTASSSDSSEEVSGFTRLGVMQIIPNKQRAWAGSISVASTLRRIDSGFSSLIVSPGIGPGFHAALLEYRQEWSPAGDAKKTVLLSVIHWIAEDVHCYVTLSASTWHVPRDSSFANVTDVGAVMFGAGAMRVFPLAEGTVGGEKASMAVEIGPSYRKLGGDISLADFEKSRRLVLGTAREGFMGYEGGMQVQVGEVGAFFHFFEYGLGRTGIRGITATQVIAGINVRGPLLDSAKESSKDSAKD